MVKSKPSMTGRNNSSGSGSFDLVGSFEGFLEGHSTPTLSNSSNRELDVSAAEEDELGNQGLNSNALQLYLDRVYGYGKAEVISNDEFNDLVDGGAEQMFRGMPDSRRSSGQHKLEQVMYGDKYYAGDGVYGDGLYFTTRIDTAGTYAAPGKGSRGSVMRAALKPTARTVQYEEVYNNARADYPNYVHDDSFISSYALSRGYDAIRIPRKGGETYYVVLNRSALYVDSGLGTATGGSVDGTISFEGSWRL